MRSTNVLLASSVLFGSSTPAFSTSASNQGMNSTSAVFFGYSGGPTKIPYGIGIALQGNFTTLSGPIPTTFGGQFNLIGSNVLEKPMFVVAASAFISSTGSFMLRDSNPWYQYVDFQFIPSTAMGSSAGMATIILSYKGNT